MASSSQIRERGWIYMNVLQEDVKYLSVLQEKDCMNSHIDVVLLHVNSRSAYPIDIERDYDTTLCLQSIFQNVFQCEHFQTF